jgi:hypothetical protein
MVVRLGQIMGDIGPIAGESGAVVGWITAAVIAAAGSVSL